MLKAQLDLPEALIYRSDIVQIKEMKDAAMMAVDPYVIDMKDIMSDVDSRAQQQAVELQAKPFISLLNLIGEIYQVSARCSSSFAILICLGFTLMIHYSWRS
jgi:hypothetical protein